MRRVSLLERLETKYISDMSNLTLGEVAEELSVKLESVGDIHSIAERFEERLNEKLFMSYELRDEPVEYSVTISSVLIRYYLRKTVTILGIEFKEYVDILLLGKNRVAISSYGVESCASMINAFQQRAYYDKDYTLGHAIRDSENRPDNCNIQYNRDVFDSIDCNMFEDYTSNDKVDEEYSDDFDDAVFK